MFENRNYTVYDDEGNAHLFKFDKYYRALLYGWWVWFSAFWISMFFFNEHFLWYMHRVSYALVSNNSYNALYIISLFPPLIYLIIIGYFYEKHYKTNLLRLVDDQEVYEEIVRVESLGWFEENDSKLAHIPNEVIRYKSAKYIAHRYNNDNRKLTYAYFIFWAFVKLVRLVIAP